MYANVLSFCKLRITKENEENRTEKEKKGRSWRTILTEKEIFYLRCGRKMFDLFGEKEAEKEKEETQMENDGQKNEKGKIGLHSTQPLATRWKDAQICCEIRNLNKKSQVGCRGWWLKGTDGEGAEHFEEGESDI